MSLAEGTAARLSARFKPDDQAGLRALMFLPVQANHAQRGTHMEAAIYIALTILFTAAVLLWHDRYFKDHT